MEEELFRPGESFAQPDSKLRGPRKGWAGGRSSRDRSRNAGEQHPKADPTLARSDFAAPGKGAMAQTSKTRVRELEGRVEAINSG